MLQIRLTTLGAVAAAVDSPDGRRHLGRSKPVALLAYLAAAPGRRASRERLATLLWSEGSSEQARQNLRQTIWYIRRRLGPLIHGEDDTVTLEGDIHCDRDEFLRAVREHRLVDAVQLYVGDFIPEFAAPGAAEFEDWAEVERRRMRGMFVACCDTLAREALSRGQFTQAVDLARRARDAAPMDLGSWRLLLESLAAARDQLGCVAELEHLEAQLAASEIAPDAALRSAMRAAREAGRRDATAAAGTNGSSGDQAAGSDEFTLYAPDLIGREQEFRTLLGHWEDATQGRGSALLVTGVAGLGKSRLLMDLHARLRASRARTLFIRANLGDRAVNGGFIAAVAEALAQRPGAAAVSGESAGVLVALAPSLSSVFPSAKADVSSGADADRRRVSALLDLLRAVSEERPLALLVDDIHWADEESRRVLDAVTARVAGSRVLLVLSARPPIETLGGFAALERIELQHFDIAKVAEFVSRVGPLPAESWAAELPVHLLSASRGLPLTLIELLQRLVDTGALTLIDGSWASADPRRIGEVLREGMVLEARVRSLGPAARETLLLLATLGRPAHAADLLAALRGDGPLSQVSPFDGGMVELEHRGFVVRAQQMIGVVHDEVGATALATASAEERRLAHARSARVLMAAPENERALQLAASHAAVADEQALLAEISTRWLRLQRREGRDASAEQLVERLLAAPEHAPLRRRLLRDIPWLQRPARRVLRSTGVVLLLALMAAAWSAMTEPESPDLEVWVRAASSVDEYYRLEVRDLAEWRAGEPIAATVMRGAAVPAVLRQGERMLLRSAGSDRPFYGSAAFPVGGGELMLFTRDGQLKRPSPSPGDDGTPTPSPDDRFVAFATARWNPENDRSNIGILDQRSGELRRLLQGPHIFAAPAWSPDGSRIAIALNSFTTKDPMRVCVVSVDAEQSRCDWPGLTEGAHPISWIDPERLVIQELMSERLWELETETGRLRSLPRLRGVVPTSDPAILIGHVEVAGARTLALLRADQSGAPRPIFVDGRPVTGELALSSSRRAPRFVASVRVAVPEAGVAVDQVHLLRLEARDSAGVPMPTQAVRFTSLDTAIAVVDELRLIPRRVGVVRVVGTAGGWRSDTATISIVASTYEPALVEEWTPDWEERWRPLGDPRPVLISQGSRRTINPNGDGKYPSGFYLRRRLSATRGLGIETRVSLPFSQQQWQHLGISLFDRSPNDPELLAWDHRSLGGPLRESTICHATFGGEGGDGMSRVLLSAALRELAWIPTPPGLYEGKWTTVRLQLMPDGRCGLALDGRAVLITDRPVALPDSLLPWITGHSDRTTVQVGRMELWTGVKGGVDWSRLP